MKGHILIYILLFAVSVGASASIPKRALTHKTDAYLENGVVIGGEAGRGFSLLNVHREISKKLKLERIILDLGNYRGQPLKGKVSYFQASIQRNPARVVLDLAQLSESKVTQSQIRRLFRKSPYIKKINFTMDPEDESSTMVFALRKPMKAEVFDVPSRLKAGRIVIDIKAL